MKDYARKYGNEHHVILEYEVFNKTTEKISVSVSEMSETKRRLKKMNADNDTYDYKYYNNVQVKPFEKAKLFVIAPTNKDSKKIEMDFYINVGHHYPWKNVSISHSVSNE